MHKSKSILNFSSIFTRNLAKSYAKPFFLPKRLADIHTFQKFSFLKKNANEKEESLKDCIKQIKKNLSVSNMSPCTNATYKNEELTQIIQKQPFGDIVEHLNESQIVTILRLQHQLDFSEIKPTLLYLIKEYKWENFKYICQFLSDIKWNLKDKKVHSSINKEFAKAIEEDSPMSLCIQSTLANCKVTDWELFSKLVFALGSLEVKNNSLWNEILNSFVIFHEQMTTSQITKIISTLSTFNIGNHTILNDMEEIFIKINRKGITNSFEFIYCFSAIYSRHEYSALSKENQYYPEIRTWLFEIVNKIPSDKAFQVYFVFAYNNLVDSEVTTAYLKRIVGAMDKLKNNIIQLFAWTLAVNNCQEEYIWRKVFQNLDISAIKNSKSYNITICQILLHLKYNFPSFYKKNPNFEKALLDQSSYVNENYNKKMFDNYHTIPKIAFFDLFRYLECLGFTLLRELPITIYNVDCFIFDFDLEKIHPDNLDFKKAEGLYLNQFIDNKIVNDPELVKKMHNNELDYRKGLILEVDGPSHFDYNVTCTKGKSLLKYRLLRKMGYNFVGINQLTMEEMIRSADFEQKYHFFYNFIKGQLEENNYGN